MLQKDLKVKFKGTVLKHYVEDTKHTLYIIPTPEAHAIILERIANNGGEWKGTNVPCKEDEEGNLYIKVSTSYEIKIEGEEFDLKIADIGNGSEVTAYAVIKQGTAKTGKYVAAYLTGLKVEKFEPFEDYNNPFVDDSYEEL